MFHEGHDYHGRARVLQTDPIQPHDMSVVELLHLQTLLYELVYLKTGLYNEVVSLLRYKCTGKATLGSYKGSLYTEVAFLLSGH